MIMEKTGVNIIYEPVINAAIEAFVYTKPTVWKANNRNNKKPKNIPARILFMLINLCLIIRKGLSKIEAKKNLKNKKLKTEISLMAFFIIIKVEPQQRATKISKKSEVCSRSPFFIICTIIKLK